MIAIYAYNNEIEIHQLPVICFQCIIAIGLVLTARHFHFVESFEISYSLFMTMLPLGIFYVIMLCSSFFSLFYCSISVIAVFKNLAIVFIVFGERFLFDER